MRHKSRVRFEKIRHTHAEKFTESSIWNVFWYRVMIWPFGAACSELSQPFLRLLFCAISQAWIKSPGNSTHERGHVIIILVCAGLVASCCIHLVIRLHLAFIPPTPAPAVIVRPDKSFLRKKFLRNLAHTFSLNHFTTYH
jgi:hypothetical protein